MINKFSSYNNFIEKVDDFSCKVNAKYAGMIACKKGCAGCCEKILTLFPVEFFNILEYIKDAEVDRLKIKENVKRAARENDTRCPFLSGDECIIYESRPVICRTFGLPAIMVNDEEETIEYQTCDMNFKGSNIKIEKEYVINLNTLNSMLVLINSEFVKIFNGYGDKNARLSMVEITEYL